MKRFITILLMAMFPSVHVLADGGLWMVNLVDKVLAARMQEAGMRFDPSAIYDPAKISFSDAVVSLDFTCTASMVSDKGLMITNHHCAYADISALSTEENNYLEDGFWALDMDEEIPVPGRKAYFLRYVIDVTSDVEEYTEQTRIEGKSVNLHRMRYLMEKAVRDETGYEARLSSSWCGEKYYMSLYEVYSDVRLVAAPPAAIASFGGDTDNWQWPQHKGEFAIYRVYAAPDGSPAEYAPENVPYEAPVHLSVSLKGYKPGDFSMIIGFPGSTERYKTSCEIDFTLEVDNPHRIFIRGERQELMMEDMMADEQVKIQYATKYSGSSNYWKNSIGESQGLKRLKIKDRMSDEELMAIIGHEMGHIRNSDTLHAMRKAYLTSAARNALGAAGGVLGSLSASQWGSIAEKLAESHFSKSQEYAADDFSFGFLQRNGYDPIAMADALEKIHRLAEQAGNRPDAILQLFSTHPDSLDRAARIRSFSGR